MKNIEELKQSFQDEMGISLYRAFELYGIEVGTIIFDDEPLQYEYSNNRKELLETIASLKTKINITQSSRDKWREDAIKYSIPRSTYLRTRFNRLSYLSETFVDTDKLKKVLLSNTQLAFNPVVLSNGGVNTCKCIFKPSKELAKSYDFLEPVYVAGGYKILYYNINIKKLKNTGVIHINESDILGFYYDMYHPLIRGLILNNEFNLLLL